MVIGDLGEDAGKGPLRVRVRRAEAPVQLVRMNDRTFYGSLRRKLGWGGPPKK